ncbi:MarC family protein [Balneolaceae bacterium ANBcel3]|nr:MarC family protein [Balneolaceae bacterium ANBcel3]
MELLEIIQTTIVYLLITIAGIFVIVNPLTTSFVFMSLTTKMSEEEKQQLALKSTKIATSLFFVFALLGGIIFQLFGITLAAFRIAGGIILFGIAMGMIQNKNNSKNKPGTSEGQIADDISVIPLAIPFISGPGSIATVMILTSEAPTIYHTILVFFAVLVTTVSCYYSMIYSKVIVRYLGDSGKEIITKIFGLILAVISVQFVINGVANVIVDYGIFEIPGIDPGPGFESD